MKKLVLGVVALGVMVNVAWAYYKPDYCSSHRTRYANCFKYESGDRSSSFYECRDERGYITTLEKLRMRLEACQVEYSRY